MKENCSECPFNDFCFKGLSPEQKNIINETKITLNFKKGELICKRGSPVTHIIFLKHGFIKWHVDGDTNNKNVIFKLEQTGTYVGIPTAFGDRLHHFSTTAIDNSKVCLIDINLFMEMFRSNPTFATSILEFICKGANDLFDSMYSYTTKNVNGRVALLLLYLSKQIYKSNKFTLTLSRQELSEFIAISKDNLIHTMSKLNKEGVIRAKAKTIEILKEDSLIKISMVG